MWAFDVGSDFSRIRHAVTENPAEAGSHDHAGSHKLSRVALSGCVEGIVRECDGTRFQGQSGWRRAVRVSG